MGQQKHFGSSFSGWSWSNPERLYGDEGDYSLCTDDMMGGRAILTGYGFTIPSDATGFKAEWRALKSHGGTITPSSLQLLYFGSEWGDNRYSEIPDFTTSATIYSVGGEGETWSFPDLTPNTINNTDFGIVFHVFPQFEIGQTLYLDYVAITVYFVGGSQTSKRNMVGLSPKVNLRGKMKPLV